MIVSLINSGDRYDELIRMTRKELSVRFAIFIVSYGYPVKHKLGGIVFNYQPNTHEMIIGSHAQKMLRSLCDIKPENEPITLDYNTFTSSLLK